MYSEERAELRRAFDAIYPPGAERLFNHVGLFKDPVGKRAIQKHQPVVNALNIFLSTAWTRRENQIELSNELDSEWN